MMVPTIEVSRDGPCFSRIVHGLWRLAGWDKDRSQVRGLIDCCLEHGITTFDHADIYGDYTCEQLFGAALAESGIERSRIQFVTKCGIKLVSANRPNHRIKSYDTSGAHITASVDNSLKSLKTDYIDLLLIHRPDPLMNAAEVNAAFVSLREAGKVRHFGVSNFLPSQFEMLAARLDVPLVTNQIEYSVMCLDAHADGTLDLCEKLRLRPMAWSPLAGGRLFHEDSPRADRLRQALRNVGHQVGGASMDQIALAWVLMHPAGFLPVLGTGNASRIKKAVVAFDITLSREQWFEIWTASSGRDVP
jgi:predicted oxidoreductase